MGDKPAYRERLSAAELRTRADQLHELLISCSICPRACRVNRCAGERGICRSVDRAIVSSAAPHFGEEPPLVGAHGSGTIFFTSCNLQCVVCQNYEISQLGHGREVSIGELAGLMLRLQDLGCHNVNLVTPTHVIPQIVGALAIAADRGLSVPLVYNCGGYESVQSLRLLQDIVDIYMPDVKYADNETASRYSGVDGYWNVVRAAVKEMHRQVGDLSINDHGIARRGVLIRHLVLPYRLAGTSKVLEFIAKDISTNSYINIMEQYRPAFRADEYPELHRPITEDEYEEALTTARDLGLRRGFPIVDAAHTNLRRR